MPWTDALLRFQDIDQELQRLNQRLAEIGAILQDTSALTQVQQSAEQAARAAQAARKAQKDVEFELQKTQGELKQTEQRLYSGSVTNPRQLEDLQAKSQSLASGWLSSRTTCSKRWSHVRKPTGGYQNRHPTQSPGKKAYHFGAEPCRRTRRVTVSRANTAARSRKRQIAHPASHYRLLSLSHQQNGWHPCRTTQRRDMQHVRRGSTKAHPSQSQIR